MSSKQLYSFDIFDTLVTRRVATPMGIFAIMQKVLIQNADNDDFLKNNFYQIRIGAEEFARFKTYQLDKHNEITIDDIYDIIGENYNLTSEEAEFLKQLEISTEIKDLLPIDKNLSILKDLIAQNKRVVLISDMYYGEEYLRKILSNIDPVFEDIKIYSSADYKESKAEGSLYSSVQKEENVDFENWTHYGDNKKSDIINARQFDIKAVYTPQEPLMPYEEELVEEYPNNCFYQAAIGSSKLSRLNKSEKNGDKYDFGASFAGTILYSYVDWILNQSLKRGFKTLYFVARDGYILKVIADIIIQKRNLPLKTKYLYGSRLAWRIIANDNYEPFINSIFSEYTNRLTPRFLAYRFGIDENKLTKWLNLSSPNERISYDKIKDCISHLTQNEEIKHALLSANEKKLELLKRYMLQEIDFEEKDIALVDLYGSGKTQDCLADVLNQIKTCKIYGFYLTNSLMAQSENSVKISYFQTLKYMSHWIELLCRNLDGQTTGYEENNGKILPVTEKGNGEFMAKWGFDEYLKGIIDYTNNMLLVEEKNGVRFNALDLYCRYFDYLAKNLDKKTANVMGEIPFLSIGHEDKNIFEAAPRFRTMKMLCNFLLGRASKNQSEFPFISMARSGKISKLLQKTIYDCPTLQKFLFNVYIHKRQREAYIRILGIKISFRKLLWGNK